MRRDSAEIKAKYEKAKFERQFSFPSFSQELSPSVALADACSGA
jgi:hypothetical protein